MKTRSRRRTSGAVVVGALTCALGVSACGGFDSAASGEHLINDYVKKFGQGKVTVKSAKCPGGVKETAGATYDCKVVLHDKTTGTDHSGTITIHIASGNKVEITGSQDLHFQ
ncbi:MAG TPA: hypothetical protein VMU39_04065 [Solirubrobacteraceae bacterium]|nr:hypothetical protein [Solirubrobacteraceae bacterium]